MEASSCKTVLLFSPEFFGIGDATAGSTNGCALSARSKEGTTCHVNHLLIQSHSKGMHCGRKKHHGPLSTTKGHIHSISPLPVFQSQLRRSLAESGERNARGDTNNDRSHRDARTQTLVHTREAQELREGEGANIIR